MESFMEVGQGPNWGCSANGKKKTSQNVVHFIATVLIASIMIEYWETNRAKQNCVCRFMKANICGPYSGGYVHRELIAPSSAFISIPIQTRPFVRFAITVGTLSLPNHINVTRQNY
jgi:hypothetical protein